MTTLAAFLNQPFTVPKASGNGKLVYELLVNEDGLCIHILRNLGPDGKDAGGTFATKPVSLGKILSDLKAGKAANNNDSFWRTILKHQGITV